jgi:hypothetical protein
MVEFLWVVKLVPVQLLVVILYGRMLRETVREIIFLRPQIECGHMLRRNCLLQQVIEGKIKEGIEVT